VHNNIYGYRLVAYDELMTSRPCTTGRQPNMSCFRFILLFIEEAEIHYSGRGF
jgi:hypothetical protein